MSIKIDKGSPAWYGNQEDSESFLDTMYKGKWSPEIRAKQTPATWIIDEVVYPNFKIFEKIFKVYENNHKDYGNGQLYYKKNMGYPADIDPNLEFQDFIKETVSQQLPSIKVGKFTRAWGVHYVPGAYSGLHAHTPGQQLTAVMFLNECETSLEYPLAGSLITCQPLDHEINYTAYKPKPGNVVIMEANIFHGTYPTLNERRVFVCDFEYEHLNGENI